MKRTAIVAAVVCAACDLSAAALDYGDRNCAAIGCTSGVDGGMGGGDAIDAGGTADAGSSADAGEPPDAGPMLRANTVLFRADAGETFVVLRIETPPASSNTRGIAFLEERRLSDGALVASENLAEHGLALSTSTTFHGGLSRSGDGRSLTVMVYEGTRPVVDVVSDTVVRRVLVVRRSGLDWSTAIADAFSGEAVFSVATHDGSSFWVSGNAGNNESALHEVVAGSMGVSRFVLRTAPFLTFLAVTSGRLLAARHISAAVPSGIDDLAPVLTPLDASAPRRLVSLTSQQRANGLAALDLDPSVVGVDVLYVPSHVIGPGLRKYVFDGTTWVQQWATRSVTALSFRDGCMHVAARPEDGGVVVLCTADGDSARELVRFDDFGAGDAGPSPRLLARIEGDGRDGGAAQIFRGIAFAPD